MISELNNDVVTQSTVGCIFCDGDGVTLSPSSAESSLMDHRRTTSDIDTHSDDTRHRSLLEYKSTVHDTSLHLDYSYRRSPRSYDVTAASSRSVTGISRDYKRKLNMANKPNDRDYSGCLQPRDVIGRTSSRTRKPTTSNAVLEHFIDAIRAEQRASQGLLAIRSAANVRRKS